METDITYPVLDNVKKDHNFHDFELETRNNLPTKKGLIISPFYEVKINDVSIPCYTSKVTHGLHSFCNLFINKEVHLFPLKVEVLISSLSTVFTYASHMVRILPIKKNIIPKAIPHERKVVFEINDYGSYSLIFNDNYIEPLTVNIREKTDYILNKSVINLKPNDYSNDIEAFNFTKENKVYYLAKGVYIIDQIRLPSHSILYFDKGAYVFVSDHTDCPFLDVDKKEDVKVIGEGVIDFSLCNGGEEKKPINKHCLIFNECIDVMVEGITIINPNVWSTCFYGCNNVHVNNLTIFGYRVFSDGVMLSDCTNGLVENSFIRTGDDAFETKSTTKNHVMDNILFRNNDCWTDKANGYGTIYESEHDTKNVRFINCNVGFALATWSKHVAPITVEMGNNPHKIMHDIHFDDIEVFQTYNKSLITCFIGGSGGRGDGWGVIDDIYFSNITCYNNKTECILFLFSLNDNGTDIRKLYFKNIISNNILFNKKLLKNEKNVQINTFLPYSLKNIYFTK